MRGRHLSIAAAAAFLVACAVFAVTRLTGPDHLSSIDENAIGVIDPDDTAITEQYELGAQPGALVAGAGSVWVANPSAGTVFRLHQGAERVNTIDVGRAPVALAFGAGSLWVAGGEDGVIAQVDPTVNRVVRRIAVGNGVRAVAVSHGAVWAATALDGQLVRIDLRSGRKKRISVGGYPVDMATSADAVWVAAEESGQVVRVDARSGDVVKAIPMGNDPSALAAGHGAIWATSHQDGSVSRIDPDEDRVTDTLPVGGAPVALTIAGDGLWVAVADGAVRRLDPRSRHFTHRVSTTSTPADVATVDGAVWVTAVAPPAAHRGGTLRVGRATTTELDPALGGYDPGSAAVLELAYDGLLDYRRASGAAGAQLTGALAREVPTPTDAGRRYVFRLRPGLTYSDGTPVRAGDFPASLERALVVGGGFVAQLFDAIPGAARCAGAPEGCDLSRGITAEDRSGTITIRLRRPDSELLQKLTIPLFAIVPAATPRRPLRANPPPGTGPYRIDRVLRRRSALLVRNPHFRPSERPERPPGFADRVEVTMGGEKALAAAVASGRLDLAELWSTSERREALRTPAGTRLYSGALAQTQYAWLNVEAPPFDDPRVRRALNLAVDRAHIVELNGGTDAASPTCQLLPPGLPGHRPICPFTVAASPAGAWTAPDRAKARRLVAASGSRGTAVELWTEPLGRATMRHLADVLRELGIRSRVRRFGDFEHVDAAMIDTAERPQIGLAGWIADFPEPAAFLRALISCGAYTPGTPSTNVSRFCEPDIDEAINRAHAAGPDAGAAWRRIERRIAAHAPVVPLINHRTVVLTSARTGNVRFHPTSGPLLDQIWVE